MQHADYCSGPFTPALGRKPSGWMASSSCLIRYGLQPMDHCAGHYILSCANMVSATCNNQSSASYYRMLEPACSWPLASRLLVALWTWDQTVCAVVHCFVSVFLLQHIVAVPICIRAYSCSQCTADRCCSRSSTSVYVL